MICKTSIISLFFVLLGGFFFGVLSFQSSVQADDDIVLIVIVHKDNAIDTEKLQLSDVQDVFLKEEVEWDDGGSIRVLQLDSNTDEYNLFRKQVFDMTEKELVKHWADKKANEGVSEPLSKPDSAGVFRVISRKPDAIGYINNDYYESLTEEDQDKVKIIRSIR